MNNQKAYEVTFIGQDYQPINDAVDSIKIAYKGEKFIINSEGEILPETENNKRSAFDISKKILDAFLERVAPNGNCHSNMLVVNSSKANNKKLYDLSFGNDINNGYFCGIVGVIRKPIKVQLKENGEEQLFNVTLQIKSRLDINEDGGSSKPFFLSTLLLKNKVDLSNNTVPSDEDEIFDYLLLFWFKEQLQKACLKGYYKAYRRFENNDDRVKGSLDLARHIKLNAGQKNGKIAYTYRENTINNYLNHLIVMAYQHLKNKYYDLVADNFDSNVDLKGTIDYLSREIGFSNERIKDLINKNNKPIAHPFFTEYENLRQICIKILRNEGISIFDVEPEQDTQGILFYLPELWELFLEDEVVKKAMPKEIICKAQFKVDNFGYLNNKKYTYKQPTYPDYVFFAENKPFMLLDAKFKPKWELVLKEGSLSDVMEDYNKCIRDMSAINAHATGVIFPTNQKIDLADDKQRLRILKHTISGYNNSDFFYTIPIYVPPVENGATYLDWTGAFEKEIANKAEIIKAIVIDEKNYWKNYRKILESIKRVNKI